MNLKRTVLATLSTLALPAGLFAQTVGSSGGGAFPTLNPFGSGAEDAFVITYASQLNNGDSVVNISNAGTVAGTTPLTGVGVAAGDLCVNFYLFTPDQQLVGCCSCRVTHNEIIYENFGGPNGNAATQWGVPTSVGGSGVPGLLWNTTFGPGRYPFNSAVLKIVATRATRPVGCSNTVFNPVTSTPGNITAANITGADLAPGMAVWATHSHPTNGAILPNGALPVTITETEGQYKGLSAGELAGLTSLCLTIQNNGSGNGQCSCPTEDRAGGFISGGGAQ